MVRTLLPFRRFTVETHLTPVEVEARLRDAVEAPRSFRFSRPDRPFVGRVDGSTFDVMKSVAGRDSFRPRVRGTIEAAASGTRLTGTMQLHEIVIVFIAAFLGMAALVFLSMAARDVQNRHFELSSLIPLGVVVFLAGMTLGGFIPGTRRALDELVRVVDGSHGELE